MGTKMAREKINGVNQRKSSGANLGFEANLFSAADKLRKNLEPSDYKHVVLGLIFLKYISDAFEAKRADLMDQWGEEAAEDADEYRAENVFWVPKEARWSHLQANAKQPTIGKLIDDAMTAIEANNASLKGVLPKDYARPALDKIMVGELIDLISGIAMHESQAEARDVLGRVYEYFLGQFAGAEGKRGGEFYTPRSVVSVLVEMLEPYKGRVYDPCCGSGGMFVQSDKFVQEHGGRIGDIAIYGQESNYTTWRLAKMNLAVRGIDADIRWNNEGSFHKDELKDLRFDYILANPPFNTSDWGGERLREDPRWRFGIPPVGNANFAWVQHIAHHLAPNGTAGYVLGNISLTSETNGEKEIRRALLDADLVECILTLPDRLFYSTPIPAGIWILRKGRAKSGREGEVLFIDASSLGHSLSRTHKELTSGDVEKIANTYKNWRDSSPEYENVAGFCQSAKVSEVVANQCILLPAAYVNSRVARSDEGANLEASLTGSSAESSLSGLADLADLHVSLEQHLEALRGVISEIDRTISFKDVLIGDVLEEVKERLGSEDEPEILTCTESGGLILQRERFAKRVATDDTSKYKKVSMGDIVYNPYLLWKGAIDQCWVVEEGITSPAYSVFRVKDGFDPVVIGKIITSKSMIKRYDGISFGTVQRRRRAPAEKFLEMEISIPDHASLGPITALLETVQDASFASRAADKALKVWVDDICSQLM